MDLRFEAFNLIDRDPVLRSRLVTCATCLVYAGASDARASQDGFLVLAWTGGRPPNAPPGTEVLRADVHLPRSGPAGGQRAYHAPRSEAGRCLEWPGWRPSTGGRAPRC